MTTLVLETDPEAVSVTVTDKTLTVELMDGRIMVIPLDWYPHI